MAISLATCLSVPIPYSWEDISLLYWIGIADWSYLEHLSLLSVVSFSTVDVALLVMCSFHINCVVLHMYICLYMCMYIYVYVCVCECICICMYVWMPVWLFVHHVCVYLYEWLSVCVCVFVCVYVCICICICVCVYIYNVYVCICVCVLICVCAYHIQYHHDVLETYIWKGFHRWVFLSVNWFTMLCPILASVWATLPSGVCTREVVCRSYLFTYSFERRLHDDRSGRTLWHVCILGVKCISETGALFVCLFVSVYGYLYVSIYVCSI